MQSCLHTHPTDANVLLYPVGKVAHAAPALNRFPVAFLCLAAAPPHPAAKGRRHRRRYGPSQPGVKPLLRAPAPLTPLQILLRGHDMPVQSIAVSQSGRFVASGQALSPHKGMFQVRGTASLEPKTSRCRVCHCAALRVVTSFREIIRPFEDACVTRECRALPLCMTCACCRSSYGTTPPAKLCFRQYTTSLQIPQPVPSSTGPVY